MKALGALSGVSPVSVTPLYSAPFFRSGKKVRMRKKAIRIFKFTVKTNIR